jgi:CubicO group peptidase (beta-lactamase class C family)
MLDSHFWILDLILPTFVDAENNHYKQKQFIIRKAFRFAITISLEASVSTLPKENMVFPSVSWQFTLPEHLGIDSNKFEETLTFLAIHSGGTGIDEMVIVKDGYLIWKGSGSYNCHEIYSCTKTFISTVLGLLVTQGKLKVDDYATKHLSDLDDQYPEYSRIRLSHLASMTSGYNNVIGSGWKYYRTDRSKHHQHVLTYTTPGLSLFPAVSSFNYSDPAVHLLGYILTKVANQTFEQVFEENVAEIIGMKQYNWSDHGKRDGIVFNNPAGTPGENQGGVSSTPLDLARYGLLYLNKGKWIDQQILDPSFIEISTITQVPFTMKTKYYDLTGRYGFFWWTNGIRADGTRPWPSAPPTTIAAHGAGRNFIFVIPEWRMVIVRPSPAPGGHIHIGNKTESIGEGFFSRLKNGIKKQTSITDSAISSKSL